MRPHTHESPIMRTTRDLAGLAIILLVIGSILSAGL